jgi:uncharacterized delta-60 repeat protein
MSKTEIIETIKDRMKKIFTYYITIILSIVGQMLFAQPGTLDLSFNSSDFGYGSGEGVNNSVNTISLQNNGKIVFAGQFDTYNSFNRNRAARAESNGLIDPSFSVADGFNNVVRASAVQSDGKILFGGDFGQFNNQVRNRILRLNANGSIDNTFNAGGGAGASVFAIAIQPDGKVIIGGSFSSYNTTFINYIVRVNPNGSVDNTFSIGTGPNNSVRDILIQPDGKIIIAGLFTSYNGNPANRIARLNSDGSFDNTFNIGTGANNLVNTIAIEPNNKLVIAGNFTSYNGSSINRIARLNPDGSLDNTFNVGTGANAFIIKILLQPDGKVFALGDFITFNGQSRNRYARLNNDGSIDESFLITSGANTSVLSAVLQPDGKIVLGGLFALVNGTTANGVVRLNPNGSIDNSFNQTSGANNFVEELAVQNDGKILVGGNFQVYNGVDVGYLTRVNNDGSIDSTFSGFSGVNAQLQAIAIQPDNKILIGGGFTSVNGISRNRIARLNSDGSLDLTFNIGTGFDNNVFEVTQQQDGKILVGGNFVFYDGNLSRRLIRLNSNGTFDNTFNVGMGSPDIVKSIVLRTDGKIIIAGATTYKDTVINGIAVLNTNGSIYNGFTYPSSSQGGIEKVVLQPDGKIIAFGSFYEFNGLNAESIIRLNEDGSIDNTFMYPTNVNNPILTAALQPNGKIIIGGVFTSYNGFAQNFIARLNSNGTIDNSFVTGSGANSQIQSIAIQNDDKILIGGLFTAFNGVGRNRIARLNNCEGTTFSSINVNSCNAYTAPNNQVFNNSGIYVITIPNAEGCDSLITLNLNISQPAPVVLTQTACNSYIAPNGTTLTASGSYNYAFLNNVECDSLVQLNLTIVNSSSNSIYASACNSYTADNGEVYTTSGTYIQNFINTVGCDSTLTILLDVYYDAPNTINATGCTDYIAPNGVTYMQDGTYTVIIPTNDGCDSVITINLTLGNLDASINEFSAGLQASEFQAQYQWLDCDNNFVPIAGEVNREFFPVTPGNYAVQISKNGCVDTSACYTFLPLGIDEATSNLYVVFPNPAKDMIEVKSTTNKFNYLEILNVFSQVVYHENFINQTSINLDGLSKGIYFIRLNRETTKKLVKE